LWNAILTNPVQSPAYQNAYRKLVFLTQTIKDAMVRQKEKEKEAAREAERLASERSRVLQLQRQRAENERAAFQTLMQQVSSKEPIPSVADLDVGLSAFHNEGTASIGLGLSEQDRTLTEDDVETALRLLNVSTKIASMEDIYAGLTLLGVSTCVRVDEYLQEIEKGRM
ncbi:MAG: hypothetical protein Q9175_006147, partial [Cornicularia normoerica]